MPETDAFIHTWTLMVHFCRDDFELILKNFYFTKIQKCISTHRSIENRGNVWKIIGIINSYSNLIIGIVFARTNHLTVHITGNCSFLADTFGAGTSAEVWARDKTMKYEVCSIAWWSYDRTCIGYIQQAQPLFRGNSNNKYTISTFNWFPVYFTYNRFFDVIASGIKR